MSVAGRKMLRRKLDNNWRYGMPDDESIECAAKVFDIQSDAKSFIFGLENGTIEVKKDHSYMARQISLNKPELNNFNDLLC